LKYLKILCIYIILPLCLISKLHIPSWISQTLSIYIIIIIIIIISGDFYHSILFPIPTFTQGYTMLSHSLFDGKRGKNWPFDHCRRLVYALKIIINFNINYKFSICITSKLILFSSLDHKSNSDSPFIIS